MASNPLSEALDHFSLSQLMADPGLCRNVLNDVGATPAEVFLLVAGLEARVPQTLLEHSATNDLSVVEPRLVEELNQRGIERERATWVVNCWKEAVGGASLGQQTVIRQTEPVVVTGGPSPSQTTTAPLRPARKRRGGLIAAIVAVVLIAAGLISWATWPKDKHTASGTPPSRSASSSAPLSARSSTPAGTANHSTAKSGPTTDNHQALLGAVHAVVVPGTVSWTDTNLHVVQGNRMTVAANGEVAYSPGKYSGPNGAAPKKFDIYSVIGSGHHVALIGRIGPTGAPFLVGTKYDNVASATGELFLGINDKGVTNNAGLFNALVRLQKQ